MLPRVKNIMRTNAAAAVMLIRVAVGWVFLSEGIQKFLYAASRGAGRFERIGIPWPELTGPFVGAIEITCGALLLAGLLTRLASVPLVITMLVALVRPRFQSCWAMASGASASASCLPTGSGARRTRAGPTSRCCWARHSLSSSGRGASPSTIASRESWK